MVRFVRIAGWWYNNHRRLRNDLLADIAYCIKNGGQKAGDGLFRNKLPAAWKPTAC